MSLSKSLPLGRAGRVSIRDVADTVGVSISTVSRALRGYADVSPGTRERVQRAALELGYTPDAAGQMLKSGRTETVAVLVSGRHGPTFLDAFYAEVVGGLEAHLSANGLSLLLLRAGSVRAGWVQGRCDGVVALGCDLPAALLQGLSQSTPLVLADSEGRLAKAGTQTSRASPWPTKRVDMRRPGTCSHKDASRSPLLPKHPTTQTFYGGGRAISVPTPKQIGKFDPNDNKRAGWGRMAAT